MTRARPADDRRRGLRVAALLVIAACSSPRNDAPAGTGGAMTTAGGAMTTAPGTAGDSAPAPPDAGVGGDDAPADLPTASESDPFVGVDGQRLKLRFAEAEGGARLAIGFFDSMLGAACSPRLAADGEWRCLPGDTPIAPTFLGILCSGVLATVIPAENPCPGPAFVAVAPPRGPDVCNPAVRIYRLGERSTMTALSSRDPLQMCTTTNTPLGARVHVLGPEVPSTAFVKLAERSLRSSAPAAVDLHVWAGEDGSMMPDGRFVDRATDQPCSAITTLDGKLHCVPQAAVPPRGDGWFADSGCQRPTLSSYGRCPVPALAVLPAKDCSGAASVHTLGPAATEFYYFDLLNRACKPGPLDSNYEFHPVEAERPADGFPRLAAITEDTSARLRRRIIGGESGRRIASGWIDSATGKSCDLVATPDGRRRCVPDARILTNRAYADAACTVPLLDVRDLCQPKHFLIEDPRTCPSRFVPHVIGIRHDGPLFFKRLGADRRVECGPVTVSNPGPVYTLTPIAPDGFAELIVRDPS